MKEEAKLKLSYFLKNPGFFSILVLGDSGVGKEFLINEVLNEKKYKGSRRIFYPFEIEEDFSNVFINNNKKEKINDEYEIIIIKNVEELSVSQQDNLFDAMSTSNDGEIGIDGNKALRRMVFTSSFSAKSLKEGEKALLPRFWHRISQLVVKIPSFKDYSLNIKADFASVWKKMEFENYAKLPEDIEFYEWLKNECNNFAGNYRDLDTIAILWHQYRMIRYDNKSQKFKKDIEKSVFKAVKSDFDDFGRFPTQKPDGINVFEFKSGYKWDTIEENFRSSFKKWAKENYGTLKVAIKELDMPSRKMDKW